MKKRLIKWIVIVFLILLIVTFSLLIYKNIFASSSSSRYKDIEKYDLTNNEINSVKDNLNELESVKDIDIYIDSKIIKIVLKLENDVDFEQVKTISNESLSGFEENNLTYYDVEIFIESSNKESEIYPQIGYKFKTSTEFSW